MNCPKCGQTLFGTPSSCYKCGADISEFSSFVANNLVSQQKGNAVFSDGASAGVIIGAILAIVATLMTYVKFTVFNISVINVNLCFGYNSAKDAGYDLSFRQDGIYFIIAAVLIILFCLIKAETPLIIAGFINTILIGYETYATIDIMSDFEDNDFYAAEYGIGFYLLIISGIIIIVSIFKLIMSNDTTYSGIPRYSQQNDNDGSWICSECGKKNASYVGTCGCGMDRRKSNHQDRGV